MKNKSSFVKQSLLFVVAVISILSCSPVKKSAIDCPDLSSNIYYRPVQRHASLRSLHNTSRRSRPHIDSHRRIRKDAETAIVYKQTSSAMQREVYNIDRIEYNKSLTASVATSGSRGAIVPCNITPDVLNGIEPEQPLYLQQSKVDTIVMRSGARYAGKVQEIGLTEVKYKRSDNPDGPTITIRKSDIDVIKYSNGTSDYFTSNDYIPPVQQVSFNGLALDTRKNQGLAVAGFVTSLSGLLIFGILLGTLSVIFGGVSLGKIKREPGRYKGKGFSIAAIIIGLVDIIGVLILLASMA